jgi:hypothetical protein
MFILLANALSKKGADNFFSRDTGVLSGEFQVQEIQAGQVRDPAVSLFTSRRANDAHDVAVVENVGFSKTHSAPSVHTVQNVLA